MTFCSIVAYCDAQYLSILDSDTWSLALTRLYYCAVSSSGMILAAEANYKVQLLHNECNPLSFKYLFYCVRISKFCNNIP